MTSSTLESGDLEGSPYERQPLLPQQRQDTSVSSKARLLYQIEPYLPKWIINYRKSYILADLVGATTVASLYIPLCFSFATIAHVPPSSSLNAFFFHPIIYAITGFSSLMIVGPEATGSLLVGATMKRMVDDGDGDQSREALSGLIVALSGVMLCSAAIMKLGFMDSMLSRPLMKGFISGVGATLIIEQAIPGVGLQHAEEESGAKSGPPLMKLLFLMTSAHKSHLPSCAFSFSCLGVILLSTHVKKRLSKSQPWVILFPERLIVLVASAMIAWYLELDQSGLAIVGDVGPSKAALPSLHWPFKDWAQVRSVADTSLFVALLGYVESSVTAKSLSSSDVSKANKPNQELAALGVANFVGGCFATLPAFGGFGRSKLNAQAGGMTPMSSIFLGLISLLCTLLVSPYMFYVPKPTLSAMSCGVGIAMLQECRRDLVFFWSLKARYELALIFLVSLAMLLHSMELGVEVGLGLTLITLIRSATQSRAHLDLVNGVGETNDAFENGMHARQHAWLHLGDTLTFANAGEVAEQGRIAASGITSKRVFILDFQRTQEIDTCSIQILSELTSQLVSDGLRVVVVSPGRAFPRSRSLVKNIWAEDHVVQLVASKEEAISLAGNT